jgi:membrane-bound serine protease (ClpP class)
MRLARVAIAVVLIVLALPATAVGAQDEGPTTAPTGEAGFVEILEVSGLIDDVVAAAIEDAIISAEADGLRALVLQVNSRQAVVSDARLGELADLIAGSTVPVVAWVGPSGSQAAGKVAELLGVADRVAVAPGATLGPMGDQTLDPDRYGVLYGDANALVAETALSWDQAIDAGIVPCDFAPTDELGRPVDEEAQSIRCAAPTVGDFLVSLPQFESRLVIVEGDGEPVAFDPATFDPAIDGADLSADAELRREPLTQVRFRGLSLLDQLMHTVASPPVAYLMLVIGLLLIVFEFYSIGIGIAGLIGAVFVAFGGYGLEALPVRWWAVALLVLSMPAFMVDVQQAIPRVWTGIGLVLFTIGTLFLYPESDVSMSWIPIVVSLAGTALVVLRGMPIMVRGRFSTSVVPRDFLVDETGTIAEPAESGGAVVDVRGARWPATVSAGTAATAPGTAVRVVGTDELTVEVEPVT